MADRAELAEAALDVYPEGLALLDQVGRVVYWNRAAEIMTGHGGATLLGRELPPALEPLTCCRSLEPMQPFANGGNGTAAGTLVHAQHRRGHDLPAIARQFVLRDTLGGRIGTAAVFHPAERNNALPHGETSEASEVRESQAEMRERLESEWEQFEGQAGALGVMWIRVDQAEELRRTHGAQACETMLENMERTLANNLRPGEQIGRWGDGEFLVLSHEGGADVLANHARVLAGIARTAEFRWWGDRVSLTVSMGTAAAERGEKLADLLQRAQSAMRESEHAGGNRVMPAPGRAACSPS